MAQHSNKTAKVKRQRPRKSLGQHFLKEGPVARDMVKSALITPGEWVVEVGPGRGRLTRELLRAGAFVLAIEKDNRLINNLQTSFSDEIHRERLILECGDALNFIPQKHKELSGGYKLVANIPYYITGALLRSFLESKQQPTSATLLIQREVAERIVEKGGKTSVLSVSVSAYGDPHYIKTVKRRWFTPTPKVDSAILSIDNISRSRFDELPEDVFFATVKHGFAHKRKLLAKNLRVSPDVLVRCKISPSARAEDVGLDQWFCLAKGKRTQQSGL